LLVDIKLPVVASLVDSIESKLEVVPTLRKIKISDVNAPDTIAALG
jgi:hypothetical protein